MTKEGRFFEIKREASFFKLCLFLLFFTPNLVFAAVINSISQTVAMGFGLNTPGNSGGTIKTSIACVNASGTAKKVGTNATFPCANASFVINGKNNSSGSSRNRVRVIIPASMTVTSGTNSMNVSLTLSNSFSGIVDRNFDLSGVSGGSGSVTVPIYGTITLSSAQAEGDYSGTFTFKACNNSLSNC